MKSKECNFKYKDINNSLSKTKICQFKYARYGGYACDGEDNCILFQLYKKLMR